MNLFHKQHNDINRREYEWKNVLLMAQINLAGLCFQEALGKRAIKALEEVHGTEYEV